MRAEAGTESGDGKRGGIGGDGGEDCEPTMKRLAWSWARRFLSTTEVLARCPSGRAAHDGAVGNRPQLLDLGGAERRHDRALHGPRHGEALVGVVLMAEQFLAAECQGRPSRRQGRRDCSCRAASRRGADEKLAGDMSRTAP